MPSSSVETVECILARWADGDFGSTREYFDPHVVHVIGEQFPESGVFHGEKGMEDYLRRFLAQWEHFAVEGKRLRAAGDTVLADVLQHSKGKASGIASDLHAFVAFTFRGPSIVRTEFFLDEGEALAAVGLAGS